jgi:hypothetical protein
MRGTLIQAPQYGDAEFPPGQCWRGPAGHLLQFTDEGNLEFLNQNNEIIWQSGTKRLDPRRLVFKRTGELALCDWRGYPVWDTRTGANPGAYLVIQDDGNLVLYAANDVAIWETATAGQ